MIRMGGQLRAGDVVWDPFCGSAMELIEAGIAAERMHTSESGGGGGLRLVGTDIDSSAISVAHANVAAARRERLIGDASASFEACDFREAPSQMPQLLRRGGVALVVTNPPLGRRVKVRRPRELFNDLFALSGELLRPGGRLVLINPLEVEPEGRGWKLESRVMVNLGLRKLEAVEAWTKL